MRPGLVRFAAPAAFLVAATIAILLIRSVVHDEPAPPSAGATTPTRTQTAGSTTARTTTQASTAGQEHYEIRAGDTLGTVADRFDTTVEALVELNPGVDPTGLQVGQRLRVK